MPGNSLADAFITVSPKLANDGKKGIENDLKAAGTSGGDAFSNAFGAVSKKLMKAFAAVEVGKVLGEQFANAFNGAAQREQLVGGVETLFGGKDSEAAAIVQRNAAEAFRYAGISANTYMEQATSFSASLISSLKGDTVAAANVADIAMRDMSDNANKMGSSIESIQNAYQGFAKGNFTMLDNLSIAGGMAA